MLKFPIKRTVSALLTLTVYLRALHSLGTHWDEAVLSVCTRAPHQTPDYTLIFHRPCLPLDPDDPSTLDAVSIHQKRLNCGPGEHSAKINASLIRGSQPVVPGLVLQAASAHQTSFHVLTFLTSSLGFGEVPFSCNLNENHQL